MNVAVPGDQLRPPSARLATRTHGWFLDLVLLVLVGALVLWPMGVAAAGADGVVPLVVTVVAFPLAVGLPIMYAVWSLCRLVGRADVRGPGGERIIVFIVLPLITLIASPVASVALAQAGHRGRVSDAAGSFALLLLIGVTYFAWLHPLLQHWSGKVIDPFEQTGSLEQRIDAAKDRLQTVASMGVSRALWGQIDAWTTSHSVRDHDLKSWRLAWSGLRNYWSALSWRWVLVCSLASVGVTSLSWMTASPVAAPPWFYIVTVVLNTVLLFALASIEPLGNAYYVLRLKKRYQELVNQRGSEPASTDDVARVLRELAEVRAAVDALRESAGRRTRLRRSRSRGQR